MTPLRLATGVRSLSFNGALSVSTNVRLSSLLHCTIVTTPTPQTALEVQHIHRLLRLLLEGHEPLEDTRMVLFRNIPVEGNPSMYNEVIFHSPTPAQLTGLRAKLSRVVGLLRLRTLDYVHDRQARLTRENAQAARPLALALHEPYRLGFPFRERLHGFLYTHLQLTAASMDEPFYFGEAPGGHVNFSHLNPEKAFLVTVKEPGDTLKTLQLLNVEPSSAALETSRRLADEACDAVLRGFAGFSVPVEPRPALQGTMFEYLQAAEAGIQNAPSSNTHPRVPPPNPVPKRKSKSKVKNAMLRRFAGV